MSIHKLSVFSILLFLYTPILLLVISSFTDEFGNLSLSAYISLFEKKYLIDAAVSSFRIAYISASIATFFGIISSVILRKKNSKMLELFSITPLFIPEVLLGLALLILFNLISSFKIEISGYYRVIIAHSTIGFAYATLIIRSSLLSIDKRIEEAALDLGAKPLRAFFEITLPLIFYPVIGAWIMSFIISLDDVILINFVNTSEVITLPLLIFSTIKMGISKETAALSAMIIILITLIAASAIFINKKNILSSKMSRN